MSALYDLTQSVCDRAVSEGYVAGVNVLVLQDGEEKVYCESGYRDLEGRKPIARDSIFRLYSMSKPVTAAAALMLAEQGVISLNEPVKKYLPAFDGLSVVEGNRLVPAYRDLNLRDLMSMQSGMLYDGDSPAGKWAERVFSEARDHVDGEGTLSTVEFAEKLGQGPAEFQPGSQWRYGSSADIMGAVIEVASGKKFGTFLKESLFDPLSMKDTGFFVPEDKKCRFAKSYDHDQNGCLVETPTTHLGISYRWKQPPAFESGGAGLVSTIEDYKNFCLMLLNGGAFEGKRILRPRTVQYMASSQLLPSQRESCWHIFEGMRGYGYGNFCRTLENPGMSYDVGCRGEFGWDGWLGCYFSVLPEQNAVFLTMKQLKDSGTDSLTRKLRGVILPRL